ncbi:aspartyl/asparaginyl beta-hydroxylase domain-containing protein [Desulfobacterota bacterium AH_259_B03_O07]|nr:aspartyl/asparaginyl beta-hydroxylase domain-containing protein [Desulfobacterota bacterium AH_259_B03_O07]
MNTEINPESSENKYDDNNDANKYKALNPPTTLIGKTITAFIEFVEKILIKFSIHGNPPIYDNSTFPWAADVEQEWQKIRRELDQIMQRREELPSFHEIMSDVKTITQDDQWKTFFLSGYGLESKENCRRCPETARILKRIPGMKTAFFSILSPKKHIPPHRGPYNGVLRYHLGLKVPDPKDKCRIRIKKEITHWSEGESLIFDDSFNHEVWNDTNGHRAVLFVDFERPVKFPFNLLNKLILSAAVFSPFIKEAQENQKRWEKRFYKQ